MKDSTPCSTTSSTKQAGKGDAPRKYNVAKYDAGWAGIKWDSEKKKEIRPK